MEFVNKGNQYFVEEQYQEACSQYTKAIAKLMGNDQFPAMFGRARCFMQLEQYNDAIGDFGNCVGLNHKHQLSNYYLGMCMMKVSKQDVDKMKLAHKYLVNAQHGSLKQDRFTKAVDQCTQSLRKLQPKVEITKPATSGAVPTEDTESKTSTKVDDPDIEMKSNDPPPTKPVVRKIRESWYQCASKITFTLYAKNVNPKDVSIQYEDQKVVIRLTLKDGVEYTRTIETLHEIEADKCSFTMNKYKIIVSLIKRTVGDWESLETVIEDQKNKAKGPWTTKRDWNEVQKFATKELEKEKPEGDEALNSLFSKIYGDATDEQKRAMNKSFQTSGGTVLSTNWEDVKDKDYEGKDKVLPTGQDVAKWEY